MKGRSEWSGRLTFPTREASATSPSEQIMGTNTPIPHRSGQEALKAERLPYRIGAEIRNP